MSLSMWIFVFPSWDMYSLILLESQISFSFSYPLKSYCASISDYLALISSSRIFILSIKSWKLSLVFVDVAVLIADGNALNSLSLDSLLSITALANAFVLQSLFIELSYINSTTLFSHFRPTLSDISAGIIFLIIYWLWGSNL